MSDAPEPRRFAAVRGTVVDFDEEGGHGTIQVADGSRLFFHCTCLADGSRSIPVGTAVDAWVAPRGPGDWEAVDVRRVSP